MFTAVLSVQTRHVPIYQSPAATPNASHSGHGVEDRSYRTGVGLGESERHPAVTWKCVNGHLPKIARVLADFAVRPLGYVSARENEAGQ